MIKKLYYFIFISYFLIGCGYQFIGADAIHQSTKKSITIPVFYNNTFEPLLEKKATEVFKEEFIKKGNWNIVNEKEQGGLMLSGKITSFGQTPISLTNLNKTAEYRVIIQMDIKVEDSIEKKVVFERKGMNAQAEYFTSDDISKNRASQDKAILEAILKSADDLINEMEEEMRDR